MDFTQYESLTTPCFVVEESLLVHNLEILKRVMDETGCKILLAQKCFSMYATYPLIGQYLAGTTASGLHEAKLGHEYMGKETHVYSAAYREDEMDEILAVSDHIVFNSFSQWKRYKEKAMAAGKECGLRVNPQCSTQEGHAIYDPCAPYSRMGITRDKFEGEDLTGISGLHFHTLCEQNSDDLVTTLHAVEEQFGEYLHQMKWLNFGGGHHITRADYNVEELIQCVKHVQDKYHVQVYIEPGEAVALNAGYLMSTVLDVIENGMKIAILDTSAACHMPDVLEMPYTPQIVGAAIAEQITENSGENAVEDQFAGADMDAQKDMDVQKQKYIYRLGGPTCLAGDVIGDYAFDHELVPGERLIFCDMAIYSMVKTNTFNGMNLPSIVYHTQKGLQVVKRFGYEDFVSRL